MLAREQGAACGPDFPGLRALRGLETSGVEAQGVPGKPERLAPSHPLWLRCPGNLGWQEPGGLAQLTLSPCTGQPPRGRAPRPPRSDSRPSEAARARTAPRRGLGRAAAYTWNNGVGLVAASTAGVPEGTGQRSQGRQRRHRPGARAEAARSKPGRRNPLSLLRPRWGPERDVSRGA